MCVFTRKRPELLNHQKERECLQATVILQIFSVVLFSVFSVVNRADNLVLVKLGFSALSVPRFFGV